MMTAIEMVTDTFVACLQSDHMITVKLKEN